MPPCLFKYIWMIELNAQIQTTVVVIFTEMIPVPFSEMHPNPSLIYWFSYVESMTLVYSHMWVKLSPDVWNINACYCNADIAATLHCNVARCNVWCKKWSLIVYYFIWIDDFGSFTHLSEMVPKWWNCIFSFCNARIATTLHCNRPRYHVWSFDTINKAWRSGRKLVIFWLVNLPQQQVKNIQKLSFRGEIFFLSFILLS